MSGTRNHKFDNLKCVLIFFVLWGHFLDPFVKNDVLLRILYMFICAFHMPAFVYVSGRFMRPRWQRTLKFFGIYAVFQVVHTLFRAMLAIEPLTWSLLFTPVGVMWYMFAMVIYSMVAFVIPETLSKPRQIFWVAFSILCAVAAGMLPFINSVFALSRIIVFLPFFLMGRWRLLEPSENVNTKTRTFVLGPLTCVTTVLYCFISGFRYSTLWHNRPYVVPIIESFWRTCAIGVAILWVSFLLVVIPNKHIKLLTDIGKSTLFIYLTHEFVTKTLFKCCISIFAPSPFGVTLLLSLVSLFALYGINYALKRLIWSKFHHKCVT